MNENNGFNIDNNLNVGDSGTVQTNEPVTYDSYYNHVQRKSAWPIIIAIVIIILIVLGSLWWGGFFTPMDRQAEYNKLYTRVCAAAVDYANENYSSAMETTGKIVYVTVGELSDANLIEASLRNYLTNEPIPTTTDVRLEVLPSGTFQCHGFLFAGVDTIKPVVTLNGEAVITTGLGVRATDPGATATDDLDGDISEEIKRSGNVNFDKSGTYTVNYVVADRSGNLSAIVQRTYIVQ